MNYLRPELLDKLAGEYVLGTMTARTRRRFQALLRASPLAQRAVQVWEQRLSPLALSVPPQTPSAATWAAIERRTGDQSGRAQSSGASWWRWLKPVMGVAFGVVATLGLIKLYPDAIVPVDDIVQARGMLPASYVGLLTDANHQPVVLASSTRHGRILSIRMLRKVELPAGKVLQLWALPAEGAAFPLGVVPAEGKGTLTMADTSEKLLSKVPRLAVSIEDAPVRAGTTPAAFVLTGNCVKLW